MGEYRKVTEDEKDLLTGAVVKKLQQIEDYWQLITNGPIVTINNPFLIVFQSRTISPIECNQKIYAGQKIVTENYLENRYYQIVLENGAKINISLEPMDYICPEAVYISDSNNGQFVVF